MVGVEVSFWRCCGFVPSLRSPLSSSCSHWRIVLLLLQLGCLGGAVGQCCFLQVPLEVEGVICRRMDQLDVDVST